MLTARCTRLSHRIWLALGARVGTCKDAAFSKTNCACFAVFCQTVDHSWFINGPGTYIQMDRSVSALVMVQMDWLCRKTVKRKGFQIFLGERNLLEQCKSLWRWIKSIFKRYQKKIWPIAPSFELNQPFPFVYSPSHLPGTDHKYISTTPKTRYTHWTYYHISFTTEYITIYHSPQLKWKPHRNQGRLENLRAQLFHNCKIIHSSTSLLRKRIVFSIDTRGYIFSGPGDEKDERNKTL
jgi:hypothetical protein